MVDLACNYEPTANLDDASCEFGNCPGCNDSGASNYNPTSTNDENCEYVLTFTNCGQEGRFGPSIEQLNQEYGAGSGITVIDGIQQWVVPTNGTYMIEAFGAQGGWVNPDEGQSGATGGLGAKMQGYFQLNEGQMIHLLIGQMGGQNLNDWTWGSGGGGGTFVVISDNTPLIIAGAGAGGGGNNYYADGQPGLSDTSGGDSFGDIYDNETIGGIGGVNGNGGGSYYYGQNTHEGGGAGGGFYSNGGEESFGSSEGIAFLNGGYGGSDGCGNSGYGGFGGGGGGEWCYWGSTGAGGGYSGGGGSGGGVSGGGGSYNSGTSQDNESGVNEGHGRVVITLIP
jgi:hypothetical protein